MPETWEIYAYIIPYKKKENITITTTYVDFCMKFMVFVPGTDIIFIVARGARAESEPNRPPFMTVDMVMKLIKESQDCRVILDPQNRAMVVQPKSTEQKPMVYIIRLEPLLKNPLVADTVNALRLFPLEKVIGASFCDESSSQGSSDRNIETYCTPLLPRDRRDREQAVACKPKPSPIYAEKAAAKPQAGDEETDPVMRELELLLSTDAPL